MVVVLKISHPGTPVAECNEVVKFALFDTYLFSGSMYSINFEGLSPNWENRNPVSHFFTVP